MVRDIELSQASTTPRRAGLGTMSLEVFARQPEWRALPLSIRVALLHIYRTDQTRSLPDGIGR